MRPYFNALLLLVGGLIYHRQGQGDWFSLTTATDVVMTPAQMVNEIIASVNFVGAMILVGLAPGFSFKSPKGEV